MFVVDMPCENVLPLGSALGRSHRAAGASLAIFGERCRQAFLHIDLSHRGHMAATRVVISVHWVWYPRLRGLCAIGHLAVAAQELVRMHFEMGVSRAAA